MLFNILYLKVSLKFEIWRMKEIEVPLYITINGIPLNLSLFYGQTWISYVCYLHMTFSTQWCLGLTSKEKCLIFIKTRYKRLPSLLVFCPLCLHLTAASFSFSTQIMVCSVTTTKRAKFLNTNREITGKADCQESFFSFTYLLISLCKYILEDRGSGELRNLFRIMLNSNCFSSFLTGLRRRTDLSEI